jgi:orotate phosphoribosyltransferase
MEEKAYILSLDKNPIISMKVIPGHFTTSNAHISHYLDVSRLKSNSLVARDVARELAIPYLSSTLVDTIVCMERTEVIGAYLAEELRQSGVSVINEGNQIHVVTPISNNIGNLSFQSSMIKNIVNRNILLLTASISSGRTLDSALDCIEYYRGKVAGISALFLAPLERLDHGIHALFTSADIPGYKMFSSRKCEMCQSGQALDALVSTEGYTKI